MLKVISILYLVFLTLNQINSPTTAYFSDTKVYMGTVSASHAFYRGEMSERYSDDDDVLNKQENDADGSENESSNQEIVSKNSEEETVKSVEQEIIVNED